MSTITTTITTITTPTLARPVLADLIPLTRLRDTVLVLVSLGLLIPAGQTAIPLWFTPVPPSLATFAVLRLSLIRISAPTSPY